jgi:hypothetical protein
MRTAEAFYKIMEKLIQVRPAFEQLEKYLDDQMRDETIADKRRFFNLFVKMRDIQFEKKLRNLMASKCNERLRFK